VLPANAAVTMEAVPSFHSFSIQDLPQAVQQQIFGLAWRYSCTGPGLTGALPSVPLSSLTTTSGAGGKHHLHQQHQLQQQRRALLSLCRTSREAAMQLVREVEIESAPGAEHIAVLAAVSAPGGTITGSNSVRHITVR
jgi:hypothetical protein